MPANAFRSRLTMSLSAVCLLALLTIHLPAQGSAPQSEPVARAAESAPVDIVVKGALDGELQPLLAALEDKRGIQLAAWTFWRGQIASWSVVISRTEWGPVTAVVATILGITSVLLSTLRMPSFFVFEMKKFEFASTTLEEG